MKKSWLVLLACWVIMPSYAQGAAVVSGQGAAAQQTTAGLAASGQAATAQETAGSGQTTAAQGELAQQVASQDVPLVQMDIVIEPGPGEAQQQGQLLIALDAKRAPITCRNFLNYVEDHFYDGMIFHRLIADFMIQGGGFTPGMKAKSGKPAIPNEATADLKNVHGTIAMARTMEVDSASSQFFINFKDNGFLDHRDDTAQGYGYAAFGRVIAGIDWLDSLQKMPTRQVGDYADVPTRQIIIKRVRLLTGEARQQALQTARNVAPEAAS
jgi:cyclophilin family peptidyl-prolyl cis-trans isomerase